MSEVEILELCKGILVKENVMADGWIDVTEAIEKAIKTLEENEHLKLKLEWLESMKYHQSLEREIEQLKQTIARLKKVIEKMAEFTADSGDEYCIDGVDCMVTDCADCIVKHFEEVENDG